jgi:hypothetical protein
MSEPYEAGECPACGSENTGLYNTETAHLQGFGARCYTCSTIWRFPSTVGPGTLVARSFADMIFQPVLTLPGFETWRGDR